MPHSIRTGCSPERRLRAYGGRAVQTPYHPGHGLNDTAELSSVAVAGRVALYLCMAARLRALMDGAAGRLVVGVRGWWGRVRAWRPALSFGLRSCAGAGSAT